MTPARHTGHPSSKNPTPGVHVVEDDGTWRDEVARIWAAATVRRDRSLEIPSVSQARPLIDAVLVNAARSLLLVAVTDRAVGFAAVQPLSERTAELRYFGVHPDYWGLGVARALLDALPARLAARGYRDAELLVYQDNDRAMRCYTRHGWRPIGDPVPHPRTGKPEQRFQLTLS